jgi:glyoxylase-like metal-dependent hydrolase (beta-lactamase superfamily II)
MAADLDSLRRLRSLVDDRPHAPSGEPAPADGGWRIVPSHGRVITDATALVDHYLHHRLAREAKLLAVLGETALDVDRLLARVYDDVPVAILPIAAGSLEAHLVKLEREDRVVRHGREVRLR